MVFVGCSADKVNDTDVLNDFLNEKELVFDNVIACAASNLNDQKVSVFFYPRTGAMNFQYFETETSLSDKNDLENYIKKAYPLKEIFNGYLMKFEIEAETEKWAIVTYEEAGKTHLSNPIRLKQISKPTEYLPENISIGTASEMPLFSWQDGVYSDTKIYFQVVSDVDDNLLSGTYTYDKMFTYYELDNVVLNITKTVPPILKTGDSYNFTLMGVSEDNWVNQFSIVDFEIR
ncbi:hypothetical protein FB2170_08354 [Maribacter sp. HTCC2170]|nr:hypothetical protein FB2170_08354 [Maribacter sp. HTCC2170]